MPVFASDRLDSVISQIDSITSIDWYGQQVDVFQDQWLVGFESDAAASALLNDVSTGGLGMGASLERLRTLSPTGLLLSDGMTADQVLDWAAGRPEISYVEPNAVIQTMSIFPPNADVLANESNVDGLWGLNNDGENQVGWNGTEFVGIGISGTAGADISAFEAWDVTTGSRDVVIGVVDTGVDYTHPDLYQNIWVNQGEIPAPIKSQLIDVDGDSQFTFVDFNDAANSGLQIGGNTAFFDWNGNGYVDAGDLLYDDQDVNDIWIVAGADRDGNGYENDIVGWDFASGDNDPMDDLFHGTHVSGTIGAIGDNGLGVSGVNQAVLLMPLKIFDAYGEWGVGGLADAGLAIDYSTAMRRDENVNVVATNHSWGDWSWDTPTRQYLEATIDSAEVEGILLVASAGNLGRDNDLTLDSGPFPANFTNSNIIAVAATDANDQLATWSDYGLTTVDLGAPGVNILSTFPVDETYATWYYGLRHSYETISGTSMAAPHVTGTIGLLAAANPQATADEIKQAILSTVDAVPSLAGKTVTGGRLNAAAALLAMPSADKIVVSTLVDESDGDYSAGDLSLREALTIAAGSSADKSLIQFDSSLLGGTITLGALGQLAIGSNVVIAGFGADQLTINRSNAGRVFEVSSGVSAKIRGVTISGGNVSGNGGGISNAGTLELIDVVISDNYSNSLGGGIYSTGDLSLVEVTVDNNSATLGGGIYQVSENGCSLTIVRSSITDNEATAGGGLWVTDYVTLDIEDSTIARNTASWRAGIALEFSDAEIKNSTISSNTATQGSGGGIGICFDGQSNVVTLTNVTMANNDAGAGVGGGIYVEPEYYVLGAVVLHNSIVGDNFSSTGASDICCDVDPSSSHNLIGPGGSGGLIDGSNGNIVLMAGQSAGLAALGDYGGPASTHALLSDSPAVNAGSDSIANDNDLSADQRGFNRYVGQIDIGAFEFDAPLIVSTYRDELDGDCRHGDLSLREALAIAAALAGPNTIVFDPLLSAGAFVLTYDGPDEGTAPDQLTIDSDLTIRGVGADRMSISGNDQTQVFHINGGVVATIEDLTIRDGFASEGGGIQTAGSVSLRGVAIEGSLGGAGGGVFVSGGTLTLTDSTISDNSAGYGGGVFLAGGIASIINSTISTNDGGASSVGVYVTGGSMELIQSTVTQNVGGGVLVSSGSVTAKNSIIAENSGLNISGALVSSSSYNLIGPGGSGGLVHGTNGNIVLTAGQSAGLAPLEYYHGPTKNHALYDTSPALDAGDNAVALAYGLEHDQRGPDFERIVDGIGGLDPQVDIGSLEFAPIIVSTLDDHFDYDFSFGNLSLREALFLSEGVPDPDTTIRFHPSLAGGTLVADAYEDLRLVSMQIFDDVKIIGLGAENLTIQGQYQAVSGGIFTVNLFTTVYISDVTLTGGNAFYGGGAITNRGELTIENVAIVGNTAGTGGGGVENGENGNLTIRSSTIEGNTAWFGGGGGVLGARNSTVIIDSTIAHNSAGEGGGVAVQGGAAMTLIDCILADNDAHYGGGGLFADRGSYSIQRSSIVGNTAGWRGGGIFFYHFDGLLEVSDSVIAENHTAYDGGGIFLDHGSMLIQRSTISGNMATGKGGGVYFTGFISDESQRVIDSSTISGNTSIEGSGGGIYLENPTDFVIQNSTVSENVGGGAKVAGDSYNVYSLTVVNSTIAENSGVGLTIQNPPAHLDVTLFNSIVVDNVSGAESNISGAVTANSSYNLVGPGGGGLSDGQNGNILLASGQLAGLTPLGDFGGPTKTHALLSTSPAIDQGSDALVPAGVTTDQRGLARIVDDPAVVNGPGGAVDIGAFEAGNVNTLLVSILADEDDGNLAANDISLREAVALATAVPGSDTILFADALTASGPVMITLTYDGPDAGTAPDPLTIDTNVTISGPGADLLAVSGNNQARVFQVNSGVTATIRDLRITDGYSGTGGAIATSGTLTVESCQIDGSTAAGAGGGIHTAGGTLTLRNSTVASNSANYVGGGIFFGSGAMLIVNSTISGNAAAQGGGIFAAGPGLQMVNSTVTANRAASGSGIYSNTGTVLHNSIVAGNLNSAGGPTTSDIGGSFAASSAYNLIGYDSSLTNGINNGVNHNLVGGQSGAPAINPMLSALGYYGGRTMTHVLLSGSLAIDAGDNAIALAYGLDEDQRGEDRIVDWDGVGGDRIDIGAVELAFGESYS